MKWSCVNDKDLMYEIVYAQFYIPLEFHSDDHGSTLECYHVSKLTMDPRPIFKCLMT